MFWFLLYDGHIQREGRPQHETAAVQSANAM